MTKTIRDLLAVRYPLPEWVLSFEVADATGGTSRRADAIALNCYPSKGLEVHGHEIKVARSDWLRELRDGSKADTIARHCDRWWIVAPAGVVERAELPRTWGLLLVGDSGLRAAVPAKILPGSGKALDRSFAAALLRGILSRAVRPVAEDLAAARAAGWAAAEESAAQLQKIATDGAAEAHEELRRNVAEFERASGLRISSRWDAGDVGAAVHALRSMGGSQHRDVLSAAERALERAVGEIRTLREALPAATAAPDADA